MEGGPFKTRFATSFALNPEAEFSAAFRYLIHEMIRLLRSAMQSYLVLQLLSFAQPLHLHTSLAPFLTNPPNKKILPLLLTLHPSASYPVAAASEEDALTDMEIAIRAFGGQFLFSGLNLDLIFNSLAEEVKTSFLASLVENRWVQDKNSWWTRLDPFAA